MRRAAMAVVVSACVSGVVGVVPVVHAATSAQRIAAAMKVVQYHGYELSVPVTWPVYQLGADPDRCVRYDVHAVYLGMPGADQDCPPGLVGRTETVSVGGPAFERAASAIVVQRVPLRGQPAVIMQDVRERELGMLMSAPYGDLRRESRP